MENTINKFLSRYKSDNTKKAYRKNLIDMLEAIDKELSEIKLIDLDDYINNLSVCNASKAQRVATIKSFFTYLKKMGYVNTNVALELESPSYKNKIDDYIPFDEAVKLIEVGKNPRDKAIVATYLSLGLRVTELINLTMEDYQQDKMIVKTKGDKDRVMFLNNSARIYIDEYLKVRKPTEYNNIFISNRGNPMNADCIRRTLKTLANRAGIDKNICNHALRHTLTTKLIEDNGIESARQYIGHSDIKTTQRYSHVNEKRIEQIANSINL